MKQSFAFLLFVLTLFSCSTDSSVLDPNAEEVSLQQLSFQIQTFETNYENMGRLRTTTSSTKIEDLYYFVFDKKDNKELKRKHLTGEKVLEQLTDSLPQGDYYISILASPILPAGQQYEFSLYPDGYEHGSVYSDFKEDTFYKTFELSVRNAAIEKEIILERIIGRCDIIIDDRQLIPENVASITFAFKSSLPKEFYLKSEEVHFDVPVSIPGATVYREVLTVNREQILASSETDPLSFKTLGYASNTLMNYDNVTLYMYFSYTDGKASDTFSINKEFKIYKNKVTKLSGKLFDPLGNSFQLTVNDIWEEGPSGNFDNK